ncbi:NAD(P)/FAD-dependent oxidoreductase [Jannaschia sp. R86511]|uniref:NAD(P)/FAD-dependent oxidoreductase n=1 Tax=Jannaschia sp. R86511 TaxID=3093853 RepID=UPI0036D21486
MGEVWDLVVVGAGPAGSAAALAALRVRPGARVLLLDRAAFPRDKPCGDGIAPHALDVLADLGLPGLVDDHRPVHRLHLAVDRGRAGPAVVGDMRRPARVVPRTVLDDRIRAGALAAGAVPGRGTVRAVQAGPDGVTLTVTGRELRARVVVAADGAGSAVRRSLGLAGPPRGHLALALRGYAPVRADLADEQRIVFADDDRPAYAWSFPVGDGRANVGYGELLRDDRPLTRERLLRRLEDLLPGTTAGGTAWRGHHLPLSSAGARQPDGRVLLAGDALSLVNPMTGEGLYYAVLSGACAGAAAVAAPGAGAGAAHRRMLRRRLGAHLRLTGAVAGLTARLPGVVPAGVLAAARHRSVFDDLVELGLGRGLLSVPTVLRVGGGLVRGGLVRGGLVRGGLAQPS